MNRSLVSVLAFTTSMVKELPVSTVLQNLGMVELVPDANTQIALADVVSDSPVL